MAHRTALMRRSHKPISHLLPVTTAAFAIAIFIADTIAGLEIAVGVFYVAVVLLAARFSRGRTLVLVAVGCVALTLLSYYWTPHGAAPAAITNTFISLATIGLATFLVLQGQSAEITLREQANLLSLTHDAIFVRNLNATIRYWNRGAEEMYGWTAAQAAGAVSHELLKTVFPVPLVEIEAEVLRAGRWEGELVHFTKEGIPVVVASRWSLQRDARNAPLAILEINNDITDGKRAEQELREQAELLNLAHDAIIVRDPESRIRFWNPGAEKTYDWAAKQAIGKITHELLQTRFPVSRQAVDIALQERGEWEGELTHITRQGTAIVVTSHQSLRRDEHGTPTAVLEINRDVTERKRAEALLAAEKHILEMVARGDSLAQILDRLCRLVEEQATGTLAAVLLLEGGRLVHAAAPTLPQDYTAAIDGIVIDASAGSCATAAYRCEQVIVPDIAADPSWADYREAALRHSLRACWSTPIFSSERAVIGTFAMYYREPCSPSSRDQEIIEQITNLAGIAIQRKLAEGKLRRSEAYLAETQRQNHTGSWAFNAANDRFAYWSEENFRIWGLDPQHGEPTKETLLQRIHPEDRHGVREYVENPVRARRELNHEFRIVLPDGAVRHIHTIGHSVFNASGQVVEIIGMHRDVTERKRAEEERQAHLWFLESMDRVNRAIQGTNDPKQMMSDVLDAVLAIFDCDRAWLMYPCDPESPSWHAAMERTRPELPGAFSLGSDLPLDAELAHVCRLVRNCTGAVRLGAGAETAVPNDLVERFSVQSQICMAVVPKGDRPYMFGLHQCTYARVWTANEERLFQEIGRRLTDALGSLLMFRNLGESERKLEEAQRMAHLGYWDRDLMTGRVALSDEACRIFDLPPEEALGDLTQWHEIWQALIYPEDRQATAAAVAAALRGGPRYDAEYRIVRRNGEMRHVHSRGDLKWDEAGRPQRMFGTVQDITDRKRVEQRILVQHAVTQILAQAASVEEATPKILKALGDSLGWDVGALWRVDRDAGVLRCVEVWHGDSVAVPAFESTTRKTTFAPGIGMPGMVWLNSKPRYIGDLIRDANFQRAPIATREQLRAAFGFPILLGKEVLGVIEFFSREIGQPDEELLATMATIGSQVGQFIERKRAENSLLRAQAELTHVTRVSTLGEMTASIAHEINQPLGAIVNNASAALRWLAAQNVEESRRSVGLIIEDGHRVGEIIQRIRSLAKKAPAQKDWIDIHQIIREVIVLARGEVQRNNIELDTRFSDDVNSLPLLFADRIQLQQVILNLVMNAVEAIRDRGEGPRRVVIRTGAHASGEIEVKVEDSGPGLASEDLQRLFTPFYTTKLNGMGMGLAICRSIVEVHGGRLWATANQDRGATFHCTLPTGRDRSERPA